MVEQLFAQRDVEETPLEELPGLEPRVIKLLEAGGIFSVEDLVENSIEDLTKIDGIGEKTAKKIMDILAESIDFEDEYEEEETGGSDRESGAETSADDAAGSDDDGTPESENNPDSSEQ